MWSFFNLSTDKGGLYEVCNSCLSKERPAYCIALFSGASQVLYQESRYHSACVTDREMQHEDAQHLAKSQQTWWQIWKYKPWYSALLSELCCFPIYQSILSICHFLYHETLGLWRGEFGKKATLLNVPIFHLMSGIGQEWNEHVFNAILHICRGPYQGCVDNLIGNASMFFSFWFYSLWTMSNQVLEALWNRLYLYIRLLCAPVLCSFPQAVAVLAADRWQSSRYGYLRHIIRINL